jgi:H+/Cl- antiporter ClcA
MAFPKKLSQLCTPAYIYFIISVIGLTIAAIQNIGNSNKFCLGSFSCRVPSVIAIFIVKIIYILFWTWILNLMCKDGHTNIAWFLLLLPFILLFVLLGMVMVYQKQEENKMKKRYEGMTGNYQPHPPQLPIHPPM